MEYKSGGISIKRKRTGKKIEPTGIEYIRMKPTRMKYIRMQYIIIRPKAVGKRTKLKGLYRRIKYIRKGKIVVYIRITYKSIK